MSKDNKSVKSQIDFLRSTESSEQPGPPDEKGNRQTLHKIDIENMHHFQLRNESLI